MPPATQEIGGTGGGVIRLTQLFREKKPAPAGRLASVAAIKEGTGVIDNRFHPTARAAFGGLHRGIWC